MQKYLTTIRKIYKDISYKFKSLSYINTKIHIFSLGYKLIGEYFTNYE